MAVSGAKRVMADVRFPPVKAGRGRLAEVDPKANISTEAPRNGVTRNADIPQITIDFLLRSW